MGIGRVTEARELGAWTNRAQNPAHTAVSSLECFGGLPSDSCATLGKVGNPVVDSVIGKVRPVRSERVRLDRVDANVKVGRVNVGDDVRARFVEDFVAPFELQKVIESEVVLLQHRAHRAIGDDHALFHRVEQRARAVRHR